MPGYYCNTYGINTIMQQGGGVQPNQPYHPAPVFGPPQYGPILPQNQYSNYSGTTYYYPQMIPIHRKDLLQSNYSLNFSLGPSYAPNGCDIPS